MKRLNDAESIIVYTTYISSLSDYYYKKGNHSAVTMCNAVFQQRMQMLELCSPHECSYFAIGLNYGRFGDDMKKVKYLEAALEHEKLSIEYKINVFQILYWTYIRFKDHKNAVRIVDAAVEYLPIIISSKAVLLYNADLVVQMISFYEKMGKKDISSVLLQHSIKAAKTLGGTLRNDALVMYTWHWIQTLYNSGNFSACASAAEILLTGSANGSVVDYSCVRFLLGLSLYKGGNSSEGLRIMANAVTSLAKERCNTNISLIAESCILLLYNMQLHKECTVYPLRSLTIAVLMQIYDFIFSFPIPLSTPESYSIKQYSTDVDVHHTSLVHISQHFVSLNIQNWLNKAILAKLYPFLLSLISIQSALVLINCVLVMLKLLLMCVITYISCCYILQGLCFPCVIIYVICIDNKCESYVYMILSLVCLYICISCFVHYFTRFLYHTNDINAFIY